MMDYTMEPVVDVEVQEVQLYVRATCSVNSVKSENQLPVPSILEDHVTHPLFAATPSLGDEWTSTSRTYLVSRAPKRPCLTSIHLTLQNQPLSDLSVPSRRHPFPLFDIAVPFSSRLLHLSLPLFPIPFSCFRPSPPHTTCVRRSPCLTWVPSSREVVSQ